MPKIFFDHHSSTFVDEAVLSEMIPLLSKQRGSYLQPQSIYQQSRHALVDAFDVIKKSVGATEKEIFIFCASREEAISHVYDHVYKQVVRETGRNHLITLACEDAPILMGIQKLEKLGCHSTLIPIEMDKTLCEQDFVDVISPRTALITLSLAHGSTGVIQSLESLKEICEKTRD